MGQPEQRYCQPCQREMKLEHALVALECMTITEIVLDDDGITIKHQIGNLRLYASASDYGLEWSL